MLVNIKFMYHIFILYYYVLYNDWIFNVLEKYFFTYNKTYNTYNNKKFFEEFLGKEPELLE